MSLMSSDAQKTIRSFNIELFVTMLLLFAAGMFTLYSATKGPGLGELVRHQLFRFLFGMVVGAVILFIDPQVFKKFAYVSWVGTLVLLIVVLIMGKVGGGAQSWLNFGLFPVQPSELAKLTIVLAFARFFSESRMEPPFSFTQLIVPSLIVLPPFLLICVQPDFGTAIILLASAGTMILFLRVQWKVLLVLFVAALITIPIGYNFVLKDYQRNRVITFLNPGNDPRGTGYNALQTRIAVGSGELFGKGYLKGTQSQLNFIPEQHTDFVFSVFAEEMGFAWSMGLLGLMFLFIAFALRTVARARDKFEMLLGFGLTAIFFWHVFINLGMVIGILPIVGVTLPFISYGGSSLVTFLIVTALILNLSRKRFIF